MRPRDLPRSPTPGRGALRTPSPRPRDILRFGRRGYVTISTEERLAGAGTLSEGVEVGRRVVSGHNE